jgi:hypothetical protein
MLITEEGYEAMLTKGLSTAIEYFSVNDQYKIYGLDGQIISPSLTGSKTNLGNGNPALNLAGYEGIPELPLSNEESGLLNKRVGVKFFSSDCDGGFDLNGVQIKIHLARYFNYLTNFLTQDFSFTHEGLTQSIYDYIYATVEEEDILNGGYNSLENVKKLDISVGFKSSVDTNNYFKFNNRFVQNGSLVNQRGNLQNSSPFHLDFVTNNGVPGAGLSLSMMPDFFGYVIDGSFYRLSQANSLINSNGINNFTSVIPAARLNNVDYTLVDGTSFNTNDPLLGPFTYGFKNASRTKTLLEALIERAIGFMKSNTTLDGTVYKLPINYKVTIRSSEDTMFNQIYNNNNYGGDVDLELVYDPNDITTTDIIEVQ